MLYMGKLVGHDPHQLLARQNAKNPAGRGDSGMFGFLPVAKAFGVSEGMI